MPWFQREITLPAMRRGFHLITRQIVDLVPEIQKFRVGLLHLFIQHTSASLTINENADALVPADLETAMNHLVSEDLPFEHTYEGPDDMTAHVKASLLGNSLSIPIRDGALGLGVWQGIYLCEHRNVARPRHLLITIQGESG